MLYDTKWDVETKADPMSLDTLIAWLKKQPARKTYCYIDHGKCLLGQYFTAMGFQNVEVYSDAILVHRPDDAGFEIRTLYPDKFNAIALIEPRTFGGALRRARERRELTKG